MRIEREERNYPTGVLFINSRGYLFKLHFVSGSAVQNSAVGRT